MSPHDESALPETPMIPGHELITDHDHIDLPRSPRPSRALLTAIFIAVPLLLVVAFVLGLTPKLRQRAVLADEATRRESQKLRVQVAHPTRAGDTNKTTLPGTVSAIREAVIYARTSGYLSKRLVDIGDRVKTGQLLAILETPEVDEQILQARATLEQARASREQAKTNLEFARISLERIRPLTPAGVASQQDLDQRRAAHDAERSNLRAAEAAIAANLANVRRLTELKNFSRVVAPFAGTIVERDIDVGALITAGNGTGQALFKLSAADPVRVFASVPQRLSTAIHEGQRATLTVREYPGRTFVGKVTRDAKSIDVRSRTLLTEVQIANRDGALLPGMYAEVTFETALAQPELMLDGSTLIATPEGERVAVVDSTGHVRLRPITIDIDYGARYAVSGGLSATDLVVQNANGELRDGVLVEAIESHPPASH